MMATHLDARTFGRWRLAAIATIAALLACPLIAMQFTDQVRWNAFDFAAAAALLVALAAMIEIAFRLSRRTAIRAVAGTVVLAAFLLIWVDGAVGVF